ncbi:hypothetical protein B5S30_g448 [[Candida] boidinii]|nr:hypothetical protein B5S30_g448 [[Candida] boidinii]
MSHGNDCSSNSNNNNNSGNFNNNKKPVGNFKKNGSSKYQMNKTSNNDDDDDDGSPYFYNFNQKLDNLKVVNEDLRKLSESSNELSAENDSDNPSNIEYTLNRNTTNNKSDPVNHDFHPDSNSASQVANDEDEYHQDDTPVDEDEFVGGVGEISVDSFYEDAEEVARESTEFNDNYFNTNDYNQDDIYTTGEYNKNIINNNASAIDQPFNFMKFNEEKQNHNAQRNKLSKSNSFSTSSFFSLDDCSLEDSPFQNDTSKRKRRNSISQVTDITEFREKFQSQSKDFIRAETFYSPSPLVRLKATRSTPSLSRYHSGDEKTLRSIMKKQNSMDSYSCPNTALSKMAVSFKESVQVVNYDPLDCTTGLKNPFPISVKNSPKINAVFRSSTIDRVPKTPPKISRSEFFGDPDKIGFREPNENVVAANRNNSITKFEKPKFSDDFSTKSHDNKPMDRKRNYLNVVKMDSRPDNTEININSQNTFTPSDMKSVLCVTSGGGDSNDSAITKKKKLDAAAFYSDDSLKRLKKSSNSTNEHEVCEFLQENNEGKYSHLFQSLKYFFNY